MAPRAPDGPRPPRPLTIAISALGGQGGAVLTDWIVKAAECSGYVAQATSVPGVAQRTGATIYYIELFPAPALRYRGRWALWLCVSCASSGVLHDHLRM